MSYAVQRQVGRNRDYLRGINDEWGTAWALTRPVVFPSKAAANAARRKAQRSLRHNRVGPRRLRPEIRLTVTEIH